MKFTFILFILFVALVALVEADKLKSNECTCSCTCSPDDITPKPDKKHQSKSTSTKGHKTTTSKGSKSSSTSKSSSAAKGAPSKTPPKKTGNLPSCYSKAKLTQYWIPKEGEKDMLNDGKIVTLTGALSKTLKSDSGKTIAQVSEVTYEKFQMEGTGLLKSGVMVNLGGSKDTFEVLNRKKSPYGIGNNDNALKPWTSVASNDLKQGTKLYIKEIDGAALPDGKKHNGCVSVDDKGWSFDNCQLDWFVLMFTAYQSLDKAIPETISVIEADCEIINYVTPEIQKWAVVK